MYQSISLIFLMLLSFNSMAERASAYAGIKRIQCKGNDDFKSFDATLDFSGYENGSNFSDITNANSQIHYQTSRMICESSSGKPGDFGCIGYSFGIADDSQIMKVDLKGYQTATISILGTKYSTSLNCKILN